MSIKTQLQAAIIAHQAHQAARAEELYLAILQADSTCTDALNLLGILYAQQERYAQAIVRFEQALTLDPHSASTHNHIATCLYHSGNLPAAHQHLQQALQLAPYEAEIYNNLGNIYQLSDELTFAKNHYKQAINLKPTYIEAQLNLGTIYLKEQNFKEAAICFQQIVTQEPDHPAANFQLGNIAYQQHEYALAVTFYEKIPHHSNALLNWGTILLEQGKSDEAQQKFTAVLALNPKHLLAHSNLAAMNIIAKHYDLAIPHYYEIISQDAENYTAHFNLGAVYMKQRKWESAAYHLAAATRIKDDDADAHDNYATTLLKLNREDLAREHYLKALALRPDDAIAAYRLAALTGNTLPTAAPAAYITSLFDNYAENFDHELMDALQYKVPEAIYRYACMHLLERWNLTIVDLGCGTGLCGRYFVPRSQTLIGVDLSNEMLKIADKKHIYDELIIDDMASALEQWQEQIDVITAADSFVYVGDLSLLMQNCYRALAADGYLIFTLEAGANSSFELQRSGRYSHNETYIRTLAQHYHFEVNDIITLKLREEKGIMVSRWLIVLHKPIGTQEIMH